jgi:hypothetical protein
MEMAMKAGTGKAARTATATTLSTLKREFDQWRAARRTGARIPPRLWDAAFSATAQHGAYRVARELNLDYAVLKRRATQATGTTAGAAAKPRFVELLAPPSESMPAPAGEPHCVVELANARGATMRLQLRGNALGGLPALCHAFWSA